MHELRLREREMVRRKSTRSPRTGGGGKHGIQVEIHRGVLPGERDEEPSFSNPMAVLKVIDQ